MRRKRLQGWGENLQSVASHRLRKGDFLGEGSSQLCLVAQGDHGKDGCMVTLARGSQRPSGSEEATPLQSRLSGNFTVDEKEERSWNWRGD